MADRYFVGGSGARNWNDTANWSDASGGPSGASVPTSADTAFFDANSLSGTCTLTLNADASCFSFDASELDAMLTISSSVYSFSCHGNFKEHALNVVWSLSGTAFFYQRGNGIITTNGNSSNRWNRWIIDGVGITVLNGDNMDTVNSAIYLANGTWNTNGKNISTRGNFYRVAGTSSLILTDNVMTVSNWDESGADGGFVCGTSTVNVGYTDQYQAMVTINHYASESARPFYDVNFRAYSVFIIRKGWHSTVEKSYITFHNLTFEGTGNESRSSAGLYISGTLTVDGRSKAGGMFMFEGNSYVYGAGGDRYQYKLFVRNSNVNNFYLRGAIFKVETADWDLSDIADENNDLGGNEHVIFASPVTLYFYSTTANPSWKDVNNWFLGSGGTGGNGRIPRTFDIVYLDENSFSQDAIVSNAPYWIPEYFYANNIQKNVTLQFSNNEVRFCGTFFLSPKLTLKVPTENNRNISIEAIKQISYDFDYCSVSHPRRFNTAMRGLHVCQGDITKYEKLRVTVGFGSIDLNDFDLTVWLIDYNYGGYGGSGGTLYSGTGKIVVNGDVGGTFVDFFNAQGCELIINQLVPLTQTKQVRLVNSPNYFRRIEINLTANGDYYCSFPTSCTIDELVINKGRIMFAGGGTYTIQKLQAIGTPSLPITMKSSSATPFNMVKSGDTEVVNCDYLELIKSNAAPSDIWYAGSHSTNGGNNTGWIFGDYKPVTGALFTCSETSIALMLGKGLLSLNLDEFEDAGGEAKGDAFSEPDFYEKEMLFTEISIGISIQSAFSEIEQMESMALSEVPTSAEFTEIEFFNDLRKFERIAGNGSFEKEIKGSSKIM